MTLAERRKALGLTQERLAELVGVDRTTCVHWESGRRQPVGVTAERLEAVLAGLGWNGDPNWRTQRAKPTSLDYRHVDYCGDAAPTNPAAEVV